MLAAVDFRNRTNKNIISFLKEEYAPLIACNLTSRSQYTY